MDVRTIFKDTYQLYGLYHKEELFRAITENTTKAPQELVPGIMADTYNFYTKWDKARDQEEFPWSQMREESIELVHKYNDCDLCRKVLAALMNIIEQDFKPGR
jgi:hypothetical protein